MPLQKEMLCLQLAIQNTLHYLGIEITPEMYAIAKIAYFVIFHGTGIKLPEAMFLMPIGAIVAQAYYQAKLLIDSGIAQVAAAVETFLNTYITPMLQPIGFAISYLKNYLDLLTPQFAIDYLLELQQQIEQMIKEQIQKIVNQLIQQINAVLKIIEVLKELFLEIKKSLILSLPGLVYILKAVDFPQKTIPDLEKWMDEDPNNVNDFFTLILKSASKYASLDANIVSLIGETTEMLFGVNVEEVTEQATQAASEGLDEAVSYIQEFDQSLDIDAQLKYAMSLSFDPEGMYRFKTEVESNLVSDLYAMAKSDPEKLRKVLEGVGFKPSEISQMSKEEREKFYAEARKTLGNEFVEKIDALRKTDKGALETFLKDIDFEAKVDENGFLDIAGLIQDISIMEMNYRENVSGNTDIKLQYLSEIKETLHIDNDSVKDFLNIMNEEDEDKIDWERAKEVLYGFKEGVKKDILEEASNFVADAQRGWDSIQEAGQDYLESLKETYSREGLDELTEVLTGWDNALQQSGDAYLEEMSKRIDDFGESFYTPVESIIEAIKEPKETLRDAVGEFKDLIIDDLQTFVDEIDLAASYSFAPRIEADIQAEADYNIEYGASAGIDAEFYLDANSCSIIFGVDVDLELEADLDASASVDAAVDFGTGIDLNFDIEVPDFPFNLDFKFDIPTIELPRFELPRLNLEGFPFVEGELEIISFDIEMPTLAFPTVTISTPPIDIDLNLPFIPPWLQNFLKDLKNITLNAILNNENLALLMQCLENLMGIALQVLDVFMKILEIKANIKLVLDLLNFQFQIPIPLPPLPLKLPIISAHSRCISAFNFTTASGVV